MKKLLLSILLITSNSIFSQSIVINEVMSSNSSTISDENGDASDWIELYNNDSIQVNLQNLYLSDDSTKIKKWQFGDAVINPGEYLIIFASDKDTFINYWHTNFKISASGEKIILSDKNGLIIDSVYVPDSQTDISYGRIADGSYPWIFQKPSPGSKNLGKEINDYSDSVSVSLSGGFYSSAISIELSADSSDIYYTLDGSDPDSSSTKYSGPINIDKTTVLKAASIKENYRPSPVVYRSYFINAETDLPVISLISDPYNLFDYDYGIYADGPGWTPEIPNWGANFWMDWERPAHVEFFDDNKNLGFSENCGIEIYGAWSRSYPQKSFSVKFKDPYNSKQLDYKLFPDLNLAKFNSFVLRNSGNDFYYTHIRDAMMQTLIKDLDIDYLEYRPAAAYVNGQYWGIYNLREKISEHYAANRYGLDPDSIDLLEGNMMVLNGDSLHYRRLIDYITSHDMSTDEAYRYVDSTIDLNNCLLYFAAEVYYNNQDWPANNIKFWREHNSGKWRWILYDLDFGFNLYETNGQAEDHLYYLLSGIETRPGFNPPWSTLLPRKLMENPKIENKFINLIADLLNTNFKSDRVVSIINKIADHISNEAVKHRQRWGLSEYTAQEHLQRMISFAQQRPGYLRGFVRNFFGSGADGQLTISTSKGGEVNLNSIYVKESDSPWTGIYFQGNPVILKAVADSGYKFDGWSGSVTSTDDSITVSVGVSKNLQASFSIDSSAASKIVINEINYNSAGDFDSGDWIELYNMSDSTVDISGWYYSDSDADHKFFFPEGTVLDSHNYLVVMEIDSLFTSRFPEIQNYIGETGFGLSGSGEFMKLADDKGNIIDSLTYDDKSPWPEEADGEGATLELINPSKDNSLGENWKASIEHGTPGKINSVVTSVEKSKSLMPEDYSLFQNYPNPFNPITTIEFVLPGNTHVNLTIHDILGREVAELIKGNLNAGYHKVQFNASNLSSGVYFYRINASPVGGQAGDFVKVKKLILLK